MILINVVKLSEEVCSHPIRAHLKYATDKNFVGRPIDGYESGFTNIALLTRTPAEKLCKVQNYLIENHHTGLLIYDAYRPKRAVHDFMRWSKLPPANEYELKRKAKHYPNIEKSELFALGYIMEDSNHCYGNTVDVVLIDLKSGNPLEMGACFDYMDQVSHVATDASIIGIQAYQNRQILQTAMQLFGFESYPEEFWHFSHGGKAGREVMDPMDAVIAPEWEMNI